MRTHTCISVHMYLYMYTYACTYTACFTSVSIEDKRPLMGEGVVKGRKETHFLLYTLGTMTFFYHMQVISLKIMCAYVITYIHALYTNSSALGLKDRN